MQTSIRVRFRAWYVGTLALALLAMGAATYLLTRASLYHWLDETIEERAEALSEEIRLIHGRPTLPGPADRRKTYEGADDGFLIADASRPVGVSGARGAAAVLP